MVRTFCTNQIRNTEELSGSVWSFVPESGEHAGTSYSVVVPTVWENLPEFASYRGRGCFRRKFYGEGNVRLVCKGISHTAEIYLDGRLLGKHYNAYTPFSLLARQIPSGEHELKIIVDNRFSENSALHIPNDYMTYGGINRGIVLEHLKKAYIEYLHVEVGKVGKNGWKVLLTTKINGISDSSERYTLRLQADPLFTDEIAIDLETNESRIVQKEIYLENVSEWTPENPVLYKVRAILSDTEPMDDLIERFGFREIKVSGKYILLNGRPIRIKGFNRHEDHPMFGCAMPLQAIEQDIQIAMDLGANAIRTSHYPNDELFLDLCDEQGILVWEESHARGLKEYHMQNPYFQKQSEDCIREMVMNHKNHPCIFVWGILNECASETLYGRDCYTKQYRQLKELDRTRPRTSASNKHKKDICLDIPEIVSFNLYPEWYSDQNETAVDCIQDMMQWIRNNPVTRNKPFIVSEIGAGALYGYHTRTKDKWSEEYQCIALEHQLRAVLESAECCGVFIWQLTDIRISRERFENRPRTMNNKGIVDEYRRPKMSYEIVKDIFTSYDDYFETNL